jgi:hypothetical protein
MKTTKISLQNILSRSLIVGVLFGAITAILVVIAAKNDKESARNNVLIVIAGMTTIASLAAFEQYRENQDKDSLVEISFNEGFVNSIIYSQKTRSLEKNVERETTKSKILPWDLSLSQLISEDNSLALARLRIELEQELRKIAYHNNIDINNRPLGLVSLARELASKAILPSLWVKAIEEIVSVCDRAIHGTKISDNTAASVIRVGSQMLEELRLVSAIN